MQTIAKIPFSDISSIPVMIKDFLDQKIDGFAAQKFNLENIHSQLNKKKLSFTSQQRDVLYNALQKQLTDVQLTDKQKLNVEKLQEENTFTVVTGHQLNLFTGPSFFIYKILQTIKTADFLSKNLKHTHVVPIFWLASEDHDFDEINHFKTECKLYSIQEKSGGAVGKITLQDTQFISEFEKEFKDSVYGTELIVVLKKAYQPGKTLSEATKTVVQYLFSEFGLLFIDGDDENLKKEMKSIFSDELQHFTLKKTTEKTVAQLSLQYQKVQVNPREINLFYLIETRNRIEYKENFYQIVDTELKLTKEEILELLQQHPERFSPNALMRPVYQEKILPNLAYIGGNAEIMYWLELKEYFEYLEISFPVLIPRNSLTFIHEKSFVKMQKLDIEVRDFFTDFNSIINQDLLKKSTITDLIQEKEQLLRDHFLQLKTEASATDKTFLNMVEAEEKRQLKSFERFRKRLLRAEKIKNSEILERKHNLYFQVNPRGIWQEREYNFSVFYADFGRNWLKNCYEELNVLNSELIVAIL